MSIFKCKMCGGTTEFGQGATIGVCDSCGTKQTLPRLDDDKKANLYNRANHFRRNNDFDKAMVIYEQILNEDNTDAEAYWSLVLCRYGIEYVEDPTSNKRIATINRSQFTSIYMDEDYKSALKFADSYQKQIYEEEAKAIDDIQKRILEISSKEEPFDVFICFKETENNGRRTQDSVLANDLYHQLVQEGFKVFFSRITLEDKLGTAYEPYIFAALNSSKVMVVIGTKPEYYNAVWVKNEWSRYLALIRMGAKKMLIPAYKDMNQYDLPEEFSHLQAQDMSKLGFMQDLVRGIKKIVNADIASKTSTKETIVVKSGYINIDALLDRVFMFLEDGDWQSADAYSEKVLDTEPKNAQAYLGKLMAEMHVRKQAGLKDCEKSFEGRNNYQKAFRFGDSALKEELNRYITHINERNENNRLTTIYDNAVQIMRKANTEEDNKAAAEKFKSIPGFKDADNLAEQCHEKAEVCRKDTIYNYAKSQMTGKIFASYEEALKTFQTISGWKDSEEMVYACQTKIEEIKGKEESDRLFAEREAEERRLTVKKAKKKANRIAIFVILIAVACIAIIILRNSVLANKKYNAAMELLNSGKYAEATTAFSGVNYKDSKERYKEAGFLLAISHIENRQYEQAINLFKELGDYKDSKDRIMEAEYLTAISFFENKQYEQAISLFMELKGYKDCQELIYKTFQIIEASSEYNIYLHNVNTLALRALTLKEYPDILEQHYSKFRQTIAVGECYIVGLKRDGTVVASGDHYMFGQLDVSNWTDIISIAAGSLHAVGLKRDGTVVAVGDNRNNQRNISNWNDIISIAAGSDQTVGLKRDGTVVAVGDNRYGQLNVSSWTEIVSIATGQYFTVGLKRDGTVVAVGILDSDEKYNVSSWTDIISIDTGGCCIVGLKRNGTVVAVGDHYMYGQLDVSSWMDIISIAADENNIFGLKRNGTVVLAGYYDNYNTVERQLISSWTDIISIAAGESYTVGLKRDGTVVVVGNIRAAQLNVSSWKDIAD